jgi:preprotein translocase subunit SecG
VRNRLQFLSPQYKSNRYQDHRDQGFDRDIRRQKAERVAGYDGRVCDVAGERGVLVGGIASVVQRVSWLFSLLLLLLLLLLAVESRTKPAASSQQGNKWLITYA